MVHCGFCVGDGVGRLRRLLLRELMKVVKCGCLTMVPGVIERSSELR